MSKKLKIGAKTEEESRLKNKRRYRTVTFTALDFEAVQKKHPNRDWEEFEEDEPEDEDNRYDDVGIRVEDLPFKPAVNLYDLARLSEDEYCPLSLEDDPTCDEERSWG